MTDASKLKLELFLAKLCKRFSGSFSQSAAKLLKKRLHLGRGSSSVLPREEFINSLEEPGVFFLLRPDEAESKTHRSEAGTIWLEFSPSIALIMVRCLLGGAGDGEHLPACALTAVESRLLGRVADLATRSLRRSWPNGSLPVLVAQSGRGAVLAGKSRPGRVACVTFGISIDDKKSTMRLGIEENLLPNHTGRAERPAAAKTAPLELTAVLEGTTIAADELAELSAGDIITTETATDGEVIVKVAGIAKYAARLGRSKGRRAITITRKL